MKDSCNPSLGVCQESKNIVRYMRNPYGQRLPGNLVGSYPYESEFSGYVVYVLYCVCAANINLATHIVWNG